MTTRSVPFYFNDIIVPLLLVKRIKPALVHTPCSHYPYQGHQSVSSENPKGTKLLSSMAAKQTEADFPTAFSLKHQVTKSRLDKVTPTQKPGMLVHTDAAKSRCLAHPNLQITGNYIPQTTKAVQRSPGTHRPPGGCFPKALVCRAMPRQPGW